MGENLDKIKNFLISAWYSFRRHDIFIIAVVGRAGASVVSEFAYQVLVGLNKNTALISRQSEKIKNEIRSYPDVKITNSDLKIFLNKAAKSRIDYAIIALSMEELSQKTYDGVNFDTVMLIELPVAEDIQGTIQLNSFLNYSVSQKKKFAIRKTLIINTESTEYKNIQVPGGDYEILGFALNPTENSKSALIPDSFNADTSEISVGGSSVKIGIPGKQGLLYGLSVLALARVLYLENLKVLPKLSEFKELPQNVNYFSSLGKPFDIIVNKAASPDEFHTVFQSARELTISKKYSLLICLILANPDINDTDQKEIGYIAGKYCDRIFITIPHEERNINPDKVKFIIENIENGILNADSERTDPLLHWFIEGWRFAIRRALESARPQDTVIITGNIDNRKLAEDIINKSLEIIRSKKALS